MGRGENSRGVRYTGTSQKRGHSRDRAVHYTTELIQVARDIEYTEFNAVYSAFETRRDGGGMVSRST